MVFSLSLICNLQFILLLAVLDGPSTINMYVCNVIETNCRNSSPKTAIPVKASNVYIAACLYMMNQENPFVLWPSYNILLLWTLTQK